MKDFRTLLVFVLALLNSGRSFSQDTLVMKDGAELYGKVHEIGETTISYKKRENMAGPLYTISKSDVFLIFFKGGKRDTMEENVNTKTAAAPVLPANEAQTNPSAPTSLIQENIALTLVDIKNIPDKKSIIVSATVDIKISGKIFMSLTVVASQRKKNEHSFSNVDKDYYYANSISAAPVSPEKIKTILFDKYESYAGKGFGWALPPNFFSLDQGACSIVFLDYKHELRDIRTGGIIPAKRPLADCSSFEQKILSFVLLWLQENFGKK